MQIVAKIQIKEASRNRWGFLVAIGRIPEEGIESKDVKSKLIDFIKDASRSSMEDLKRLEADCSKYCDRKDLLTIHRC